MHPHDRSYPHLVALLRDRAEKTPNARAYTFLKDGVTEGAALTYRELDEFARALAVRLSRMAPLTAPGERVLLIYPPGIEFIKAFFGCLYAGLVAIPAPPPDSARLKRTLPRLQSILEDSEACLVLSTAGIQQTLTTLKLAKADGAALDSEDVDPALAAAWTAPKIAADDLAYLQYTSGSTSSPKGVMLTHANVLHHLGLLRDAWAYTPDSVSVTWMPYFHDYGLVDGLLEPLYAGIPCYVLSPLTFIKRPIRWLEAIQKYHGTHTQAPNFAYELCLDKITPEQRDGLDLRSWRVASNGAEPVRADTLSRFIEYFAPSGFQPEALYPAYGLAEATLLVATKPHGEMARTLRADALALERDHRIVLAEAGAKSLMEVSCGPPIGTMQVDIVEPTTRRHCADNQVGEVWIADASVAVGYWKRPEDSEATFRARIADAPERGPYLRTGDLGFMRDGELYITGRLKDLIIIAGANHYPQDVEWTVQQCHPLLRVDHCAAFSVEEDGEEHLVVVAEMNQALDDWEPLFDAVRRAVSEVHEVEMLAFVALKKGGILKTSSGKLQRQGCRSAYLEGNLDALAQWRKPRPTVELPAPRSHASTPELRKLAQWLIGALAHRLNLAPNAIDPKTPFANYGLTSRLGVELVGDLEQWSGRDDLSPTLLWEYPTVETLSRHLAGELGVPVETPETVPNDGPIAIVGMACRFPGASSPDEFWTLLTQKGDAVRELPEGRWANSGIPVEIGQGPGKLASLRAGFIDQVEQFDAGLFGITPREAEIMDPQQRLLLELTWEALERAGYRADALAGSATGVFVGISTDDYSLWQMGDTEAISAYTGPAKALSIAANRLSYQFDLLGPSMAVDTACSSSLVALHLACQSLHRGESQMALTGGVNLLLSPQMSIALSQAGMLAADGRCKTFDAAANGYVRGEGGALLVLKRLDDARRDGNHILAVVRGTAVNQDGRSNGLTAPNGLAQQRVVRAALDAAGVSPADISYIEAHGTGTPLGDPIEVSSLQAVLDAVSGDERRPIALGAVKANIGHLEAAAGVAGVCKAILSLQHGLIPPHPTLQKLNPLLHLDGSRLYVPIEATPWQQPFRLAGISSFGFGGTNAHVILGAAPAQESHPVITARPLHVLQISARDDAALRALAQAWRSRLQQPDTAADLCCSAHIGRTVLATRLACIGTDTAELQSGLDAWLEGRAKPWQFAGDAQAKATPRVGFLFTGQGAQYLEMGAELYRTEPGFKIDIDACDTLIQQQLGLSLVVLLYGDGPVSEREARLGTTALTQPALFAIEYALARLWMNWGVEPEALLGHSVGEIAAACIADVFPLETAIKLVCERARLMQSAPGDGGMVAVMATEDTVQAALAGHPQVVIAGYNGPTNHVISGDRRVLQSIVAQLNAQGIETRELKVSHGFHSPQMDPVLAEFAKYADTINGAAPAIPLISNVSGELTQSGIPGHYWVDHVRSPVRFVQGIRAMRAAGIDTFIEIGPRPTLITLGQQTLDAPELLWLASLRPAKASQAPSDWQPLLESLATLYTRGGKVDWPSFSGSVNNHLALPTYPFQRRRYWLPAPIVPEGGVSSSRQHPFPGHRTHSPLLEQTLFENRYDTADFTLLGEHRVFEQVVVPGAAHLALVTEAAASFFGETPCVLQDVIFPQALVIPEPGARRIQLVIANQPPTGETSRPFKLISLPAEGDEGWQEHANGRLATREPVAPIALTELQRRCGTAVDADFYSQIWQPAIGLGPRFRWVQQLWRGAEGEVLAQLTLPPTAAADRFRLHPGLVDSMLQILTAAATLNSDQALVPFSFEGFSWLAPTTHELWSHLQVRTAETGNDKEVVSDVALYDAAGRLVAEARGFRARRVESRSLLREQAGGLDDALYQIRWSEAVPQTAALDDQRWLLLGAADLPALANALATQGVWCAQAQHQPGLAALTSSDEQHYRLDTQNPSQITALLQALPALQGVLLAAHAFAAPEVLTTAQHASVAALHAVQAIIARGAPLPRLVLVTQGAVGAAPDDSPNPAQAALWGLARVIRLEHPDLHCQTIDLPSASDLSAEFRLLHTGLTESEPELALRAGRWLAPKLERRPAPARNVPTLRADATYLLSGGLGALGLHLAEWLVEHGARHLLLFGRSAVGAERAARIKTLTERGAQVVIDAVDIADATQLASALDRSTQPPVAGVFHLAGVLDDGVLVQQDSDRFGRVLAPKLGGAWQLHQAFEQRGVKLEQFVAFSSVAGLTGSMGQGAYAAANAAVDALMELRRRQGLAGTSLQWGPWAEVGMAAALAERDRQRFADYGIEPIEPGHGMTLLGHLLAGNSPAVMAVLPVHWQTYLGHLYGGQIPPMYRALAQDRPAAAAVVAGGFADRLAAAPADQRRAVLELQLREVIATVLGIDDIQQIAPRQRLFEMGLDSLGAVELRNRLSTALGQTLRATLLFDFPTVSALLEHLERDVLKLEVAAIAEEVVDTQFADQLDDMSDEDLAALLAAELGG